MLIFYMLVLRAFVVVLVIFSSAYADIYKYVDEDGIICYSDTLSRGSEKVTEFSDKQAPKNTDKNYTAIVKDKANKYSIDPSLVHAVIATESNYNPQAVSRKGAMGLMQLMPATAAEMGVINPYHPEQNIDGGVRYLKYLLEKFRGNLHLALAAYNAGPEYVKKYGSIPPIKETTAYVKKVLSIYSGKTSSGKGLTKQQSGASIMPITTIYKIVLADGTVLFTNSIPSKTNPSRF